MAYESADLSVLKGLDPVKKNPGMFIGDVGSLGLHQIFYEVLDNGIDEALAGYCDTVKVTLHEKGFIEVEDNGRGIPTDFHPEEGVSGLELVLTRLHAGGKFNRQGGSYKNSGGLHGVGVSCTNALSKKLIATVKRNGKIFQMEFSGGVAMAPLKEIGETHETGTSIKFQPDPKIFETVEYDVLKLKKRLKDLAYLNSGLKLVFQDLREEDSEPEVYFYEDGLNEFLKELVGKKEVLCSENFLVSKESDGTEINLAMNFLTKGWDEKIFSYTNNIYNKEGGTHVRSFNRQFSNILSKKALELFPKAKEFPVVEDFKQGIICLISVKMPDPKFANQTKDKLTSNEISEFLNPILKDKLTEFFDENPDYLKFIVEKGFKSLEARNAARKAKEQIQKGEKETFFSSKKYIPCISKNSEETELFIVEGNSAGGNAGVGRDKNIQAILKLRGKPQNIQNITISQMLNNRELSELIGVMGCGIGDSYDYSKLRFNKIIVMSDADVDGSHISILLLTFFFKYYTHLIEEGHIYIAVPPLYSAKTKKGFQYLKDDRELQEYRKNNKDFELSRFKGLGEMNADELWESTMDPNKRTLIQVTLEDEDKAQELFLHLMDKGFPHKRKEVISEKAHLANIDV